MADPAYFRDKICIVTGANSGIGYALSEELLKRGATVYMLGRNPAKVEEAAAKLDSHGDRVRTLVADVTDHAQVQRAIEGAAAEAGRLDMLFNNAGVGGTKPFETVTLEDWKNIIDANIWSVVHGVHTAFPIMLRQGSGHIVNTSSIAGLIPPPYQALYSLTKFGVTGFTECLKYEFADRGLHFSVVCPANIATAIFNKGIDGQAQGELRIPEDAYPADKAATYILDRVSEQQGIIIVPEKPWTGLWQGYVLGKPEVEENLYQTARERRAAYEKGGSYF